MRKINTILSLVILAAALIFSVSGRALAQPSQATQPAPEVVGPVPWVSEITGNDRSLQVRQPDSDWFEATVNTPLGEGDQLYQDAGGRSEIFIDRGTWLRLDEGAGVRLDSLKDNEIAAVVTRGSAEAANGGDTPFYLDVPGQTVIIDRGGRARVNVSDDGVTEIAVKRGRVRAHGPTGDVRVEAGQTLVTDANGKILRLDRGVKNNRFDRWSDDRDEYMVASVPPVSQAAYMPEPVVADFARDGVWINDPEYGNVWRPYVGPGWAPYRDGRWVYRPAWGWTWVSYERWGWYPYHYGRWVYVGSSWAWSPVYVVHRRWSPALVFWVDGPGYIAWQPWPYGVAYGVYIGPTWHTYVNPHCMTVVHYNDFHRGHYQRYARPWDDHYRTRSDYRGYAPRPFNQGEMRDHRSPRPDGFTPTSRRPGDDRLYANQRPSTRDGRPTRVNYGSTDRDQVRASGGRTSDIRPSAGRATGDSNDRRSGGNFKYGSQDRPRPANMSGRTGSGNTDRPNTNRSSADRPRPGDQGGNQGNRPSSINRSSDRPTQPGRTHDRPAGSSTRPQPDRGTSGSGNRGDSQPADRPRPDNNRPDNGSGSRAGSQPADRPATGSDSGSRNNPPRNNSRPQPSRDSDTDSRGGSSGAPSDSGSSGSGYRPSPGGSSGGSGGSYQAPSRPSTPSRPSSPSRPSQPRSSSQNVRPEARATSAQPVSYKAPQRSSAPSQEARAPRAQNNTQKSAVRSSNNNQTRVASSGSRPVAKTKSDSNHKSKKSR